MLKVYIEGFDKNLIDHINNPHFIIKIIDKMGWKIVDDVNDCDIYFFGVGKFDKTAIKTKPTIFNALEHFYPNIYLGDYKVLPINKNNKKSFYFPYMIHLNFINLQNFLKPFGLKKSEFKDYPKTEFCNFIYGNKYCKFRNDFFKALNKRKAVDSLGRKFKNATPKDVPNDIDKYKQMGAGIWIEKFYWLRPYKFTIAMENGNRAGSFSEKVIQALEVGSVPIYWGDDAIDGLVNSDAYIDGRKFKTIDELADYVIKVDSDEKLYQKYRNANPYVKNAEQIMENYENDFIKFMENIARAKKPKNTLFKKLLLSDINMVIGNRIYKTFWKFILLKRRYFGGW